MLYAFAPIWSPRRSVTRKFLRKLKSLLKYPGPRNALRAIVPKLEAVANCEGKKHAAVVSLLVHVVGTEPIGSASTEAPAEGGTLSPKRASVAVPSTMLNGKPE